MPSIGFWAGVGGGTEWYRCTAVGGALERQGWDVVHFPSLEPFDGLDVAVFQRCWESWVIPVMEELRAAGTLIVFDVDDWYDGIPAYNPVSRSFRDDDMTALHEAMRAADLITVTTQALAHGYSRFAPTVVLPNYLDPEVWADIAHYRPEPDGLVRVGWAGKFDYRADDLALLKPWLRYYLDARPQVRFVGISDPALMSYLEVGGEVPPPEPTTGDYFRPYDHLPALLSHLDVGLAPLADNRFNRCKSWCKAMEYGAAGVAAVASAGPEYRKYVRPGLNGLLVRRDEWAKRIDSVIDDLDGYKLRARAWAEAHFIDLHIHKWLGAYKEARN